MALKKEYNLYNTGINLPEAYHLIRRVEVFKTDSGYVSTLSLAIYSSKEARDQGKEPVIENNIQMNNYLFEYDLTKNENILEQAYEYLKNTPEYVGSIDI